MGTHYNIKGKYFEINNAITHSYVKEDTFFVGTLFKTDIKCHSTQRSFVVSVYGKDITYSYAPIDFPSGVKNIEVKNEDNKLTFYFNTFSFYSRYVSIKGTYR